MSADGHGIPDESVKGAHDIIHKAEQEEHQHAAAQNSGISDAAAEAEHDLMSRAEDEQAKHDKKDQGPVSKVKKTIEKLMPGKH